MEAVEYTTDKTAPLLDHLEAMAPDSSKTTLRDWLKNGRIFVDNAPVKIGKQPVDAGSTITLGKKSLRRLSHGIELLYEDEHILVINKPINLLSVETCFEKRETVHNILKRAYHPRRIFPVHRLDRETSGVMVFVSSQTAFDSLKEQFKKHSILRKYIAQVEGHPTEKKGTIDTLLIEDGNFKMHVSESDGVQAITHYRLLKKQRNTSLLELTLETGKKNQIRAHLAHIGYPILGDVKYGGSKNKRLALHATHLEFTHPSLEKAIKFYIPGDF